MAVALKSAHQGRALHSLDPAATVVPVTDMSRASGTDSLPSPKGAAAQFKLAIAMLIEQPWSDRKRRAEAIRVQPLAG